ncbi:potassium-transporting ATPase subunit KdpA [Escherichia coli]
MAAQGFLLIATFLLVLMVLARPLGSGLARLINDIPLPGTTGVERVLFRALGVSDREMNWKQYLCAILGLNMLGLAVLFFMLLGQHYLPLNPQQLPGLSWDLALNTAVSFVTNTNWQSYSGETTLSYFSQMAGLTVQNFLSAASGIAVIFALIRAFTRQSMSTLGNAWVDLLRITLWVLVPVALLIALFFIQQGALQNFQPYQAVNTVEGAQQLLPMGPVASQEAIKMLGTNGGGFFNANSSHPFENPTALTNFVQMLAIFLIPTALCFAFGEVTGDRRQGRMLLWAMSVIFVICVGVVMWAEVQGNPHLLALGADSSINMEGKESRFGVLVSSLFAVVTTAASCGAVIAMHDSFTALGGMVLMGAALAMMTDAGRSAMLNPGPHGFSEVLYAVSSAANNNGSAFAGLSANSPFWNCLLAFCMFVGRFGVIIPVMAIAGSLVSKKSQPASSGTLPTHGPLFVGPLIGTVLLVGALTFIPALALGPVAEYLS